ncbi:hypothetical protein VTL71DRAFT_2906 [Oculimacula yallundae]|uniref:Zn(2)-C6 fungal-type domain-containing protein n=1 Tax=Oculimacula yallundae TaxID=86028 RepID=A0ABR4C6V2_9HELO
MPGKPGNKPRVKAWKPKVKTGCQTCRKRHLKCDETRPSCLRCVKMGFQCDGYPRDKSIPVEVRALVPRNLKDLVRDPYSTTPSPERTLSTYHFDNPQEYLSFQIFHERSMFQLVGTGSSDLWDRVVLQACEYEGSIRNAVVAIGALSFTLDTNHTGEEQQLLGMVGIARKNAEQHQFALQKYGRAIAQMRTGIEKGLFSLRTTLICCILAACFELIEGNHNVALIHASSGLGLINDKKRGAKYGRAAGQLESFEESLGDIFVKLDRMARPYALDTLFGIQENIPDCFDGKSSEAYTTCEEAFQAWNWTVKNIYQSLDLLHSRACEVGEGLRSRAASRTPSTESDDSQEEEGFMVNLAFSRLRPDQVYPQDELDQLLIWFTAFQPLFSRSRVSTDAHFRAQAAFFQVRHHLNFIALTCAQWEDEIQYDTFHSIFKEMIELSEEIMIEQNSPSSHRPVFTFDTGVIGFLWIIATKCRDSAIRWKAVRLLLDSPTREGRWHSGLVAKGAEAVVRLEELSMQDMFIPEEARVKAEGVTFDLVSRKGKMLYSRVPRLGEFGLGNRTQEKVEILW